MTRYFSNSDLYIFVCFSRKRRKKIWSFSSSKQKNIHFVIEEKRFAFIKLSSNFIVLTEKNNFKGMQIWILFVSFSFFLFYFLQGFFKEKMLSAPWPLFQIFHHFLFCFAYVWNDSILACCNLRPKNRDFQCSIFKKNRLHFFF